MAGFLASRVRKLQESIGTATVTEDTEEVKEVKEHLKQLKTINTNIVKYSKQYTAQHEKLARTGEKLAEAMMMYSSLYPSSPLGEALVRTAETEQALAALRQALASQTTEVLVNHALRVADEELRRAVELKNSQEEARLQYDILKKRHKDLLPKSEDPKHRTKFEECEQQRNAAESNYNTFSQQLVNRLNDFDQRSSDEVIYTLKSFMMAQVEFHASASTLVQEITPHLIEMERQNKELLDSLTVRQNNLKIGSQSHPNTFPGSGISLDKKPMSSSAGEVPSAYTFTGLYDDDPPPPNYESPQRPEDGSGGYPSPYSSRDDRKARSDAPELLNVPLI